MGLAGTVEGTLQNHRWGWLVLWLVDYKTANGVGWYGGGYITKLPMELVGTVDSTVQNCQWSWLVRWMVDYKIANGIG